MIKVGENPINPLAFSIHHKFLRAPEPGFSKQEENTLKTPKPAFSERYKAHVEAERQYISKTQEKAQTDAPQRPTPQPSLASIEEAYRTVRTENRSHTTPLHR